MSPEDLFLSPDLTDDQACAYLASLGLTDPRAADRQLQWLAEDPPTREALAAVAALVLFRLHGSVAAVVGITAALGLAARALGLGG